ncbi:MAG TPA: site-2 protease family protein [Bacteroidales bacterium]|jgi:Zn-dependent protease|nr:site-2 protease family protein [Bacteroidales bacterium]HOX75353.1 site-2 protease family protein [Bacteroidales bacterium]HPM86963.1 site-2 protease family protein [Bacteroidales bacterium]HQM67952.1 site-2 protease family protein [Bacteroidales bacterium]
MDNFDILRTLKFLPGIILGLTFHEFSHAFVAHRCGDSTSRDQGRVTLNPLRHIDPLGFVMLLFAGFGWAKPVEFNEQNLRNPKTDPLKIAVSGPLSNAILAVILSVIFAILYNYVDIPYYSVTSEIFIYAIYINWGLFIFNLLPVPPLDGSHLLLSYFKKYPALYEGLYKYGSYIFLGVIILSLVSSINLLPIWPLVQLLGNGFLSLLGFSFQ